jgi:heptosyltransferase-1
VFQYLQIYDRRERVLVGLVDALLAPVLKASRLLGRRRHAAPRRILLLRLERLGDLLMTRHAIAAVRGAATDATIHLVVGSWNEPIARLLPGIDRVETLDAPWLVRISETAAAEARRHTLQALVLRALRWRRERYDLAINFEGDIRSNLLLALSGARRRIGFGMAGGGAALTDVVEFDPLAHTVTNAQRLVERALGPTARLDPDAPLTLPESARMRSSEILTRGSPNRLRQGYGESAEASAKAEGLHYIGIHASGGRVIKQWDVDRFAETATRLTAATGATIVLTGSSDDRPIVDRLRSMLPSSVPAIDLAGQIDLVTLAAVLERLDLFITGDTGPMHLAAAVGTPVVAIFGPSDPRRYAPPGARVAVVRVDLACSPCNRIRLPPERCVGHTPDCLAGVEVDAVVQAAMTILEQGRAT